VSVTVEKFLEEVWKVAKADGVLNPKEKQSIRDSLENAFDSQALIIELEISGREDLRNYFKMIFEGKGDYFYERIAFMVVFRLGLGEAFGITQPISIQPPAKSKPAEKPNKIKKQTNPPLVPKENIIAEVQPKLAREKERTPISAKMFDLLHPQTHIQYSPKDKARKGSEWIIRLSPDGKHIESKELFMPSSQMSAAQKAEYKEAWRDKSKDE
jgi:hypothetical protein